MTHKLDFHFLMYVASCVVSSWCLWSDLASCLCCFSFVHKLVAKMDENKKQKGNKNPHIESMKEDVLYHIGLSTGSQDLKSMFGDIKVNCTLHRWILWCNLCHFFMTLSLFVWEVHLKEWKISLIISERNSDIKFPPEQHWLTFQNILIGVIK